MTISNILVVEDSITQVKILQMILKREGHSIFVSYDGLNTTEMIKEHNIDIILLDIILPNTDGFIVLKEIMEHDDYRDIPIIMLTSMTQASVVKKALDMGALDYIKKPVDPIEIIARVDSGLRLKSKQDLLKDYAIRDSLTMLHNRMYFNKNMPRLLKRMAQTRKNIALAMIDCDYFKKVNDSYGHLSGDSVLSSVASTIRKAIRPADLACRFGGEEFSVTLQDTSLQDCISICERIRRNVEQVGFMFDETELHVTVSIGLAHVTTCEDINLVQLVQRADEALYAAKNHGRNNVITYEAIIS